MVLVNAAGVAEFGGFTEMSLESMQGQIHTNLLGPMYLAHFLLPEMLKVGEGQIVNVLSVAADHVFPGAA
ncbi:SDR family NAD(P)-dependent oxidoreductase, partial [Klebsiella pneumoniae]|uniref:SDR family NAD(P)-dependent oxidoreductase n=1 Tax=Klebsiella pneumoniae TaxID=573 RepID=UPI00385486E2